MVQQLGNSFQAFPNCFTLRSIILRSIFVSIPHLIVNKELQDECSQSSVDSNKYVDTNQNDVSCA